MTTKPGGITLPDFPAPFTLGTIALSAAVSTVVTNPAAQATSKIFLFSANAAAANLQGSAKSLYVSAKSSGAFTVSTANGVAASGLESFDYMIVNP